MNDRMSDMMSDIEEILISEEDLQERIKTLGMQIAADYEGKDLVLVGVLKGAVLFMADIMRYINIPLSFDFMAMSSYGKDTKPSGVMRILKDLDEDVESRHVLIIEDIIDTGFSLSYLTANLRSRNIASLKICTLLDKPDRRKVNVKVDYNGFSIPNRFVVGYGLDFAQRYRNLPFIGVLKPEVYGGTEA